MDDLELPPLLDDLESDEGELLGLETPSPLEELPFLVPFFLRKFLMVAFVLLALTWEVSSFVLVRCEGRQGRCLDRVWW